MIEKKIVERTLLMDKQSKTLNAQNVVNVNLLRKLFVYNIIFFKAVTFI